MPSPGDTIDRYVLEAEIGAGGMGTVFRARDARLERLVAIKVLTDAQTSGDAMARLLREARAAAALDHPNAVAIFDVGALGDAPYIVMELVAGRTLRASVGDANVPLETRVAWLRDAARALAAAHRRGLVHRDVKPENVMVRDDGVVKVLDFGIARRAAGEVDPNARTEMAALPTLTRDGVRMGTPVYMAPEQIRGEPVDGRADQFGWAVLAYELLSGRVPWRGGADALAALASVLTDEADERPLRDAGVPDAVRAVVLRALRKKPEERFGSMDEIEQSLERALRTTPTPDEPIAAAGPAAASPPGVNASVSATLGRKYTTDEVRAILSRAVERESGRRDAGRLGFDDLVEAAREVGVDEATLREATREMRASRERELAREDETRERDAWIRGRRRGFVRHFGIYVIVNLAFLVLGITTGTVWASMLPALFWAIGLGIHGLTALTAHEDEWREARARRLRREAKRQRNRSVSEQIAEQGAALIQQTGAALRERLRAEVARRGLAPPQAGVRVAPDATPAERAPTEQDSVAQVEPMAQHAGRRARRER